MALKNKLNDVNVEQMTEADVMKAKLEVKFKKTIRSTSVVYHSDQNDSPKVYHTDLGCEFGSKISFENLQLGILYKDASVSLSKCEKCNS